MFHWFKKHTKEGLEIPDDTPIEVSLRDRPLTIAEQLVRFTSNDEIKERLRTAGYDTFDEANDFDTGDLDHEDMHSPYEEHFNGSVMPLSHVQTRLDEQKAGMVEEMPIDRYDRAKEALRAKPKVEQKAKAEPAPAAAKKSDVKAEIDA